MDETIYKPVALRPQEYAQSMRSIALNYLEEEFGYDEQDLQIAFGDDFDFFMDSVEDITSEEDLHQEIDDFMLENLLVNKKKRRAY
jgi:hypothetical protein